MGWLAQPSINHVGEYVSPDEDQAPKGYWNFDKASGTRVHMAAAFKSFSWEIPKFLVFKVKLLRVPELVKTDGRSKDT